MPTKQKTSKRRTGTKKLPAGQKELSREEKKRLKGGTGTVPTGTVVFTVDGNQTSSPGTGILRSTDGGKTWR